MFYTSKRTVLLTALLGLCGANGVSMAAGPSWGADRHTISGAQCQPSNGYQWADFAVNPNGIRNLSTSNRYISCALPLDNESSVDQSDFDGATPSGQYYLSMHFDYSQVPATGSFTTNCTFFKTVAGVTTTTAFSVTSARTGTAYAYPGTVAAMNGASLGTFTTASFNCRLPAKVKLMTIYWHESSITDGYSYTP